MFDPAAAALKANAETPVLVAPALAAEAETAASEVPYLLDHAANIFGLPGQCARDGIAADDKGVASLAEVCEWAFRDMAAKEGETLERVGGAVRRSLSARAQSRREAELILQQPGEARHAPQP